MQTMLSADLETKYEVLSELGTGGMGVVYKARHRLTNRIVAIKLLQSQSDRNMVLRFRQEAEAASRLAHPNVITVHDFGVSDETAYLVMEYVEGTDLAHLIGKEKISPERFKNIFLQVCNGLAEAHEQGIVHRDLKPSNILLTKGEGGRDVAKIADFGIAKLTADQTSQHLTKTGEICGSPLYMSPEQCIGQPADFRSDIFSLGCVMYESVTGEVPNAGENTLETIHRRGTEPPRTFTECGITFSKPLERIILRCLEKDPAMRYQSVVQLRDDLQSEQLSAQTTAARFRSSKRAMKIAALSAACVVVLAGGAQFTQNMLDANANPQVKQAAVLRASAEKAIETGDLDAARRILMSEVYPLLQKAHRDKYFKAERGMFYAALADLESKERGSASDLPMSPPPPPEAKTRAMKKQDKSEPGDFDYGGTMNVQPEPRRSGGMAGALTSDLDQIKLELGED
jgi:serine/threonine protein kinase